MITIIITPLSHHYPIHHPVWSISHYIPIKILLNPNKSQLLHHYYTIIPSSSQRVSDDQFPTV